jgi:hypothetical protein
MEHLLREKVKLYKRLTEVRKEFVISKRLLADETDL